VHVWRALIVIELQVRSDVAGLITRDVSVDSAIVRALSTKLRLSCERGRG